MGIERAAEVFAEHFRTWGIAIPPEALRARERGALRHRGWNIRFIFGSDDGGEYLQYYATHRMTDDRHVRIRDTGEIEDLAALSSVHGWDPTIPGDEERSRRRYFEDNRRIMAELQELGLWPADDINAYLHTHDLDPPEGDS